MTTPSGQRKGRPLVAGTAQGQAVVLRQPLSLAGGLSLETGRVIDVHSPHHGELVAGRVLVMPVGRGSSTSSTALAEAIRLGTAPCAIILPDMDLILAMGSLVARTLYGTVCPIVVAAPGDHAAIASGELVTIATDGAFTCTPPNEGDTDR